MVSAVGRDPAQVRATMATLMAAALEREDKPIHWELGLFIVHDLLRLRRPNFMSVPWEPIESAWGSPIKICSLEDVIVLVTASASDGKLYRLVPSERN